MYLVLKQPSYCVYGDLETPSGNASLLTTLDSELGAEYFELDQVSLTNLNNLTNILSWQILQS